MPQFLDRIATWWEVRSARRSQRRLRWLAQAIEGRGRELGESVRADLRRRSVALQSRIAGRRGGTTDHLIEAMALASVAARGVLGLTPNAAQLIAALHLADGRVVELRSGEGKTVAAMLAAYWLALCGRHVDIATTNDYLAERDQRWMGLAYALLGMEAGVITSTTPRERRRTEYRKHVTYVANQELGFDYLRDHLARDPADQVLGALDAAIIDEVDSVLIDEARTPLVISQLHAGGTAAGVTPRSAPDLKTLFGIVEALQPGRDYTADYRARTVAFTDAGAENIARHLPTDPFAARDPAWTRSLWYALYVTVFLKPERDYIVREGKIVLVDEFTGHAMPDRRFLDGVQQAIEAQAGVAPSLEDIIVGSITYRNFFRLYHTIAGMTGTAYDAREEFLNLYGLAVVTIEPHRHPQRRDLATVFFRTAEEKLVRMVREAQRAREQVSALLVVGRTIAAVRQASDLLHAHGVPHQVLHAAVGEQEAAIIAAAGRPGTVTVATNMAGRGADIILEESIRYRYGLRVLGLEPNSSRRVDEQLRGRAGRQGQFGETRFFASLEDELCQIHADDTFWDRAERLEWQFDGVTDPGLEAGLARAQEAAEAAEAEARLSLARFDSVVDRHRQATYELRERVQSAPDCLAVIDEVIRRILTGREHTGQGGDQLQRLREQAGLDAGRRQALERYLAGSSPLASLTKTSPTASKTAILSLMDGGWQRYLESVHWLEDWISLARFGGDDPYRAFVESADKMFHEMRSTFAVAALRATMRLPEHEKSTISTAPHPAATLAATRGA